MSKNGLSFERTAYDPGLHSLGGSVNAYEPGIHERARGNEPLVESQPGAGTGVKLLIVSAIALAGYGLIKHDGETPGKSDSSSSKEHVPSPSNTPPESLKPSNRYLTAMNNLLTEISHGEGGIDSVNTGKSGDTGVGSQKYNEIFGGRTLSQLTIRELLSLQEQGKIFAVGKFQFIPDTFKSAVETTGIDIDRAFDSDAQTEMAVNYLIMGGKRPNLTAYIKGEDVSLDEAVNDLCKEFASIPCVDGSGFYDNDIGNNMATGGVDRVNNIKQLLIELRESYAEAKMPGVVMIGDSLTVGYRDIAEIAERDSKYGIRLESIDGVGGRPLVGGDIDGINTINDNEEAIENASMVIVGLGTNAVESDEQYEQGLQEAIQLIGDKNPAAKIAFITNYSYKEGSRSYQRRLDRNQILDSVADKHDNVFLINMHDITEQSNLYSEDGVHLTADGYKIASELILKQASEILRDSA